jgi:predicted secreted protein
MMALHWRGAWACRSAPAGGFTASKVSDAQAAYEAANTLQQGLLAGVNFMLHTAAGSKAGWPWAMKSSSWTAIRRHDGTSMLAAST